MCKSWSTHLLRQGHLVQTAQNHDLLSGIVASEYLQGQRLHITSLSNLYQWSVINILVMTFSMVCLDVKWDITQSM